MPIIGIEPMTYCLRDSCSTAELYRQIKICIFLYRLKFIVQSIYVKNRSLIKKEAIKGNPDSFQGVKENIVDRFQRVGIFGSSNNVV